MKSSQEETFVVVVVDDVDVKTIEEVVFPGFVNFLVAPPPSATASVNFSPNLAASPSTSSSKIVSEEEEEIAPTFHYNERIIWVI